ncbi:Hypothetical predicted protein [Xyrichtys novacula]|uniref:Uncharacterized protein n=1 Tax=Xyrichtys novacula TaxID=13765 RepID=A0AAV1FT21_XYRNO|nr:Hypothetical predicted protein [Xyrichtys novacula]
MSLFFLDISPRRAARLCRQTASVRPALEILRTTPPRGDEKRGERESERERREVERRAASASGGQCVWMRLNSHHSNSTHALFYPSERASERGSREAPEERRCHSEKVLIAH